LKANGITAVVVATVNLKADSQIMVAADCLLKLCATNVLREKCNAFQGSSQRNIKHNEAGNNECNRQATEQLITQELTHVDFNSSKKKNVNNDIFDDRPQRKVSQYETYNDQNNNMQTEEQMKTDEITAGDFNSMKHFHFNNEENPTKHMHKEVQTYDLVRYNSDSGFLLSQNKEKILPKRKRELCINDDTQGQSRKHYNKSHTQNNKIAMQVGIDISDRNLTEEKPDYYKVLQDQHRDKHISEISKNMCAYSTTKNLMNNTLQHNRISLKKKHKPQEDTQSKTDQQQKTPSKMEIHPSHHEKTCRPIPQASEHIYIYKNTNKPMNYSHEDYRLPPQDNYSPQEELSQIVPQQNTSRTKEIHLNKVNCPVNTCFLNPLLHSSNIRKPSSACYSLPCLKMSYNTHQKEINQQQYTSNTKNFCPNEINGSVNNILNPLVSTRKTSKPFNAPYYLSCLKVSNTNWKGINWQHCTSNTKEYNPRELNDSLNTFQFPVLHTQNISKSSNEHCAVSHNTCLKEMNQKHCASKVKDSHPNEENTSNTHYFDSKMPCNTCQREIKQQKHTSISNEINPKEVNGSLKSLGNPSLHTPNVGKPSNAHYSSPSSYMCQKEEKQQASNALQHSIDSIQSVQKSLRSYLSHTFQTPVNIAKRCLKDIFHRNSEIEFNNKERNEREQDLKTAKHIAKEDALQGQLEVQESQSMEIDQITCLKESISYISQRHDKGIPSPIINKDKEINASTEQIQCSQSCSDSSLMRKEPENKMKKGVCVPVRTAVSPCSWTSHTENSVRHRYKNIQPYSSSILRYSKEELDNLVAGVAKYGLDFKAGILLKIIY
jgi:hypothetical protein